MFVEALTEYADSRLSSQLADLAFESKPVPYLLEIAADGSFVGIVARAEQLAGADTFAATPPLLVPRSPVNRNLGLHPLLAFDNIKYVLGQGTWTPEEQGHSHEERHRSFVDFLKAAARTTADSALQSCVIFYNRPDQVELARQDLSRRSAQSSTLLALSVAGPVVRRAAVRNYWRQHYQRTFDTRTEAAEAAMCLVSGEVGPIAPTHEKVKGVTSLGGQSSGTVLMSCDKDAFCSYGWVKNANSPVSPQRAAAYVLALNDLLQHGRYSRVDHCGVGFLYWTSEEIDRPHPISLLEEPVPQQLNEISHADSTTLQNEVCLLGVSGNGGRLRVRFWIKEPLEVVLSNLRGWFRELRIVNPFTDETHEGPRFSHVLDSIAQHKPYARCAIQLFRRALQGVPLGKSVLAAALEQLRSTRGPKKLSPTQAALIRLCMNDLSGENSMPERLDASLNQPSYLCGRLLALYDALQYAERGWVRSSLADRYYALASTNPAQAFPKIEEVGLKHLTRLRRVNREAAARLERDLQEVHMRLAELGGTFPGALCLEDQGRFAIAFHHQKAATIARAASLKPEPRTELAPVQVA